MMNYTDLFWNVKLASFLRYKSSHVLEFYSPFFFQLLAVDTVDFDLETLFSNVGLNESPPNCCFILTYIV